MRQSHHAFQVTLMLPDGIKKLTTIAETKFHAIQKILACGEVSKRQIKDVKRL